MGPSNSPASCGAVVSLTPRKCLLTPVSPKAAGELASIKVMAVTSGSWLAFQEYSQPLNDGSELCGFFQ